MTTVRRRLPWVLAAELAVLVVTGVYLHFEYVPTSAWRDVHRFAAYALVATAVALVACSPTRGVRALVLALLAGAATTTGLRLPWDGLAVTVVRIGGVHGYRWLFEGDLVRYVQRGHDDISLPNLRRWMVLHVALGIAAGGSLAAHLRRTAAVPGAEEHRAPARSRGPGRI